MIFTNARLLFADGIRDGLQVVVEEGKIAAIHERPPAHQKHEVVDLNGNYLAPGFVDLHVHGALGRDTMEASAEAFRTICDFHASGGTTSLLLTTATAPINEIVKVLQAVRNSMEQRCLVGTPRCGVRTAQRAVPTIVGVHVEGETWSATRRVYSGPVTVRCAAVARTRGRAQACDDRAGTAWSS